MRVTRPDTSQDPSWILIPMSILWYLMMMMTDCGAPIDEEDAGTPAANGAAGDPDPG